MRRFRFGSHLEGVTLGSHHEGEAPSAHLTNCFWSCLRLSRKPLPDSMPTIPRTVRGFCGGLTRRRLCNITSKKPNTLEHSKFFWCSFFVVFGTDFSFFFLRRTHFFFIWKFHGSGYAPQALRGYYTKYDCSAHRHGWVSGNKPLTTRHKAEGFQPPAANRIASWRWWVKGKEKVQHASYITPPWAFQSFD